MVNQKIRLSQIGIGQMFGEEDVVNNRKATTTIQCISCEATLYTIKKEEFLDRMNSTMNDKTW